MTYLQISNNVNTIVYCAAAVAVLCIYSSGVQGQFAFTREDITDGNDAFGSALKELANLVEFGTTWAERELWLEQMGNLLQKAMPGYPFVVSINGLGPATGCLAYHNEDPPFDVVLGNLFHLLPCRVEHHTDGGFINWRFADGYRNYTSYWVRENLANIHGQKYTVLTLSTEKDKIVY